jgi:branched-chain amino acid transport system permease protein
MGSVNISSSLKYLLPVVLMIQLAAFPVFNPPVYFLSLLFTLFMYVALASAWNIIGGYSGYLSFGHAAFFGIGAYATALIAQYWKFGPEGTLFCCVPAGFVAAGFSVVIGYPCLRLRGPYFAVITLCFAFVVQLIMKNLEFTGGADGLWLQSMKLPIQTARSVLYELMLVVMLLVILVSARINGSRFGNGLRAIKEDEEVALTMGINAPKLKLGAFAVSAFFPGIAGGIFASYLTYIHPDVVFDVNISILIVLMSLFGGGSTWIGPVIGAASLTVVNEVLSTFVKAEVARIIYGSLFIFVIIFMPNGITESFNRWRKA